LEGQLPQVVHLGEGVPPGAAVPDHVILVSPGDLFDQLVAVFSLDAGRGDPHYPHQLGVGDSFGGL